MAGSKRGFAAMDADKQREIARAGGRASGNANRARGAAGKTEAAKRDGQNSRGGGR